MQNFDQDVLDRSTKSDCKQPCAQFNDVYQKEDLKSDIKGAFESRNSYSHGTTVLPPVLNTARGALTTLYIPQGTAVGAVLTRDVVHSRSQRLSRVTYFRNVSVGKIEGSC